MSRQYQQAAGGVGAQFAERHRHPAEPPFALDPARVAAADRPQPAVDGERGARRIADDAGIAAAH